MHTDSLPPSDRDESLDLVPATDPIKSNAVHAMNDARLRIPGDVVNQATADLEDAQRSAIRRLHAYYIENDLSLDEAAALIHLSGTTLSLVFRGKYQASLDKVVNEIDHFFDLMDRRAVGRKAAFIPTAMSKQIWGLCGEALNLQRILFIFGESQIGKTEALTAYAKAHNHGSTIYVSVPTGGRITHFLQKLAAKLRISIQQTNDDLRRRIMDSFDERMLLIVDEAHQCIPKSGYSVTPLQTIEFIREIFDERHCGVVICATNQFRDAMDRDARYEKILVQVKRRMLLPLPLPDRPKQADLDAFSAAFGLPPSSGNYRAIEKDVIERDALGMWLTLLRMAAKIAHERKQKLDWTHVASAQAGLKALSERK